MLVHVATVTNRKYIQPYRERREAERTFGRAHPILIKPIAGDAYNLADWGHCKDLKAAVLKVAPDLGTPATFALLDNDGWTASSATDAGAGAGAGGIEVETKYGSAHRANMRQSALAVPSTDSAAADDIGASVAVARQKIGLRLVYSAARDAVEDRRVSSTGSRRVERIARRLQGVEIGIRGVRCLVVVMVRGASICPPTISL